MSCLHIGLDKTKKKHGYCSVNNKQSGFNYIFK